MQTSTLCDVYFQAIEIPQESRFRYKSAGSYKSISTDEFARDVQAINLYLGLLGLGKGDKIAILSYNRPEWAIADWAILTLGAVCVPIHSESLVEQIKYILSDCGAKAIFVENSQHYQKVVGLQNDLPQLKHIITFEEGINARTFSQALQEGMRITNTASHKLRAKEVQREDLATIIYTSGTTGIPKGVMLSHKNITSNLVTISNLFEFSSADTILSFLPTSHILQRVVDYACFYKGVTVAYAESVEKVHRDIAETKPTIFVSVPRFYEIVKMRFDEKVGQLPLLKRIFLPLFKEKLSRKLKEIFGGNIRVLISGGAHLPEVIAEFFANLHLPIYEGYGLTETSPVITVNTKKDFKVGTVGKPIPGVKIKMAQDGELLAQGPNVMIGYYNKPDETNEVFKDGWFCTGDIVQLTKEGFLKVIDRKKDLFKISGGKYVAPQPIEAKLKANHFIANVVVVGDDRKYISALIVPDFGRLENYATRNGIKYNSKKELLEDATIKEAFASAIAKINQTLAPYEAIKKFHLLEADFSVSTGELTHTLKARRRIIEERYKAIIDSLYKS